MAETSPNLSLGEAANQYLSGLSVEKRGIASAEISRFTQWFGRDRSLDGLIPAEVESYAEHFLLSDTDYIKKLDLVKAFLAHAKKKGWSKTNLANHMKSKKTKTKSSQASQKDGPETVSLTRKGYEELQAELEALRNERVVVTAEIRRAAADKDFRENVPFHAAREKKGHVDGRIMELETVLKSALILEDNQQGPSQKVGLGDKIVLCEKGSEEEICYTLVSPKEVDLSRGKISNVSPLGQAILGRQQGETVEINAPVGKFYYMIKKIER
jgi:transcription elongation factor GreA